jgi:glycogen(starch) synthase
MTTDTLGGVFSYASALCAWLSSAGIRVTLATMGRRLSPEQRRAAEAAGANLRESDYRLEWMEDAWEDVRDAGRWLLNLEQELEPDVIHLNGCAHAALAWRAPVLVVAHSCVLSWYRSVLGEPAPHHWRHYREVVARGLAAATRVVAPTRAMLEMLRHEYGLPRQGEVIFNGIAPADASACSGGAASVGAARKEPFVLTAGRLWDGAKNVAALQGAACSVAWPIRAAGEASAPQAEARVQFPDLELLGVLSQEELGGWMDRAAIFASPALYEPFGLAILEAAAQGCALVLGDIPSLRELWDGCALFVEPRAASSLADAINRFIGDSALRMDLGARAAERARCYGLERMGSAYGRLYERLRRARVDAAARELSA